MLHTLPSEFVNISDLCSTIRVNLRYGTDANFVGRPLPGYWANKAFMHHQTAQNLCKAQEQLNALGFDLLIYDAYRPQRTVDYFKKWSQSQDDQLTKQDYYPYVDKATLFDIGFIASRSAHSQGRAVDVTIIEQHKDISSHIMRSPRLFDGTETLFLDDNTVDMGIHFDYFGTQSYTQDMTIAASAKDNRAILLDAMQSCGFENYSKEWWHFQIPPQDDATTYWDFAIE